MNPYQWLAEVPQIEMKVMRLPDGEMGRWIPSRRLIVLDDRLTQVERRVTLVHELVHAVNDDRADLPRYLETKQERACCETTARLLIPIRDLADALTWSQDEHDVADALWVDVETVRERIDNLTPLEKVYIESRIAARGDAA